MNTKKKTVICVIDPDLALRQRLVSLLLSSVRDVKTYANAENFLAKIDVNVPDCLIIGSDLPGIDAIEFMQQLKQQNIEIPVIVLGEEDDVPQAVSIMRAGAVGLISKPFTDQKLRVTVNLMLGNKR